jgi:hypothetical protein
LGVIGLEKNHDSRKHWEMVSCYVFGLYIKKTMNANMGQTKCFEEVLDEKIIESQEGGTQHMVALRDDEGQTMQGEEIGGGEGGGILVWTLGFQKCWMGLTQMQR